MRVLRGATNDSSEAVRRAFTLIEMLAVISIITLLLALLAPALNSMRTHARTAICGTNLSQLGRAMDAYRTDTGFYPGAHTWTSIGHAANWIVWPSRLRDYCGDDMRVFWCPIAETVAIWTRQYGSGLPKEFGYEADEIRLHPGSPFSYGYNNWGTHDFAVPQRGLGGLVEHSDWGELKESSVHSPSDMYAIADSTISFTWDAFIDHNQWPERPSDRHYGNAQTLFCDTHVELIPRIDMVYDPNVGNTMTLEQLRRWNNDHQP